MSESSPYAYPARLQTAPVSDSAYWRIHRGQLSRWCEIPFSEDLSLYSIVGTNQAGAVYAEKARVSLHASWASAILLVDPTSTDSNGLFRTIAMPVADDRFPKDSIVLFNATSTNLSLRVGSDSNVLPIGSMETIVVPIEFAGDEERARYRMRVLRTDAKGRPRNVATFVVYGKKEAASVYVLQENGRRVFARRITALPQ